MKECFSSNSLLENNDLPAPGTRWNKDLEVNILSKRDNCLAKAHTCISTIDIPFYESEEDLAKILRISINFSGLITDSNEIPDAVAEFTKLIKAFYFLLLLF